MNESTTGRDGADGNELAHMQLAARDAERRWRDLVQGLKDTIVWEADAETLEFSYVSPSAEEILGYPVDAWLVKTPNFWVEHLHPEDRDSCVRFCKTETAAGRDHEFEYRMIARDGRVIWLRDRAYCVRDDAGRVTKLRGLMVDVTRHKEAELDRERLLAQERAARRIAEAAEQGLSEILEARSRDMQRRYELLLEAAGEGIYGVDGRGITTFVNGAAARMLGYEREELLNKPQHTLVHHSRKDGSPFPAEECPIYAAFRDGVVHRVEDDVFFRKDGTPMPVSYVSTPLYEGNRLVGAVVTFRDLTERIVAEERARKLAVEQAARLEADAARARLAALFEQAPAAIAVLRGPTHLFELANPLMQQLIGRDLVGKTIRQAFPDLEGQPFFDLLDGVYRTGQPFVGREMPARFERGGVTSDSFWNFVYHPLVGSDGKPEGIFIHAVEVTDQVLARKEVERKADELARIARALEASNRELDQFAYVTSHDLKAPLRGIASLATWIDEDLGDVRPPAVVEHLRTLRGRIERMEALIEGLLQYSRIGRIANKREDIDLAALTRDVVELLAPPKEVDVRVGALPVVRGERIELQQIVQNLIGNAIKFNRREGAFVEIDADDRPGEVHLRVRDNGPGIAPEYHERIFGIFQTLEARDRVEGTGIGLAIVKKIVDRHGGRVWVESKGGEGATFHVVLPKDPPGRAS